MSTVSPISSILSFLTLFMFWMRKVVRQNSKYKITKKNTFLGLGQGQRPGWCHYWREKGVQQGRLQEHEGFVRIFFIYFLFCLYFYTKGDYKNMKNMWGTIQWFLNIFVCNHLEDGESYNCCCNLYVHIHANKMRKKECNVKSK